MPKKNRRKWLAKKNKRKWLINERRRRKIKIAVKNFLRALKEKNKELAQKNLSLVYKELDKAGKRFLHKNKVSRLKSRYAKLLNKTL